MHTFFFLMGLIITNQNLEKDASHVTPKYTYYLFFFGTKITTYYSRIIFNSFLLPIILKIMLA